VILIISNIFRTGKARSKIGERRWYERKMQKKKRLLQKSYKITLFCK